MCVCVCVRSEGACYKSSRSKKHREENVCVWGHLLLRSLAPDVRACLEQELAATAASVATDWHKSGCRLGGVDRVVSAENVPRRRQADP